jgi:hypothetical protein
MLYTANGIDFDELKDLCRNKIQWRKCQSCDTDGQQYWDGRYGEGVQPNPSGIPPEHLERGNCEDCFGIGFVLYRP